MWGRIPEHCRGAGSLIMSILGSRLTLACRGKTQERLGCLILVALGAENCRLNSTSRLPCAQHCKCCHMRSTSAVLQAHGLEQRCQLLGLIIVCWEGRGTVVHTPGLSWSGRPT